jgi:hypothetical protein
MLHVITSLNLSVDKVKELTSIKLPLLEKDRIRILQVSSLKNTPVSSVHFCENFFRCLFNTFAFAANFPHVYNLPLISLSPLDPIQLKRVLGYATRMVNKALQSNESPYNTLVTGNGETDMRGRLYMYESCKASFKSSSSICDIPKLIISTGISSAKRNDTISITVIAALPSPSSSDCDSNGHIAELVMELGGLPLALEQAGAHIKALKCTFEQYIERFKKKR